MYSTDSLRSVSTSPVMKNPSSTRIFISVLLAYFIVAGILVAVYYYFSSPFLQSRLSIHFPPMITFGEIAKRIALHAIVWSFPAMFVLILVRQLRTWALQRKVGWQKYIIRVPLLIISVFPLFRLFSAGGSFKMILLLHSLPIFLGIWLAYGWIRFVFLCFFR